MPEIGADLGADHFHPLHRNLAFPVSLRHLLLNPSQKAFHLRGYQFGADQVFVRIRRTHLLDRTLADNILQRSPDIIRSGRFVELNLDQRSASEINPHVQPTPPDHRSHPKENDDAGNEERLVAKSNKVDIDIRSDQFHTAYPSYSAMFGSGLLALLLN